MNPAANFKTRNVYYNFLINNNGTTVLNCEKQDNRNDYIIDRADNYVMQVLKFQLPAVNIPAFNISNTSDYVIEMGVIDTDGATPDVIQENRNTQSLSTTYTMNSYNDFIENYNRASFLCYRDLLNSLNTTHGNVITATSTATWDYDASLTSQHDVTIAVNHGSLTNLRLGYVQLTLDVGFDGVEAGGYAGSDHLWEVKLISPNGEECYVYSNNKTARGTSFSFEDGSYNALNTTDPLTALSGDYQPIESFIKYCNNNTQTGNWTLRFINKSSDTGHRFHGDINYTLKCYFLPRLTNGNYLKVPNTPPVLSYNETTKKLSLVYHEQQPLSNFYLGLSNNLNTILGFDTTLDSSTNYYRLKQPQVFISSAENLYLTSAQEISTKFLLDDIEEVQLYSNTLPILGEYDVASSSNIVMSLNASAVEKDVYLYFADNDLRQYDLITSLPIRDIHLGVRVKYRSSNVVNIVQLQPNTSFDCLIKFTRVINN